MATPLGELEEVLKDLATLLKNPEVISALAERKVNASLALVAAEAVAAYTRGERMRASEDFSCVAEEIAARAALGSTPS